MEDNVSNNSTEERQIRDDVEWELEVADNVFGLSLENKDCEALEELTTALIKKPNSIFLRWKRAEYYFRLKEFIAAEQDCNHLISISNNSFTSLFAEIFALRAQCRIRYNYIEDAINDYTQAIDLESRPGEKTELYAERCQLLNFMGRYIDAQQGLDELTSSEDFVEWTIPLLFCQSTLYESEGLFYDALNVLDEIVDNLSDVQDGGWAPAKTNAFLSRARVKRKLGQYSSAELDIEFVEQSDAPKWWSAIELARISIQQRDFSSAWQHYFNADEAINNVHPGLRATFGQYYDPAYVHLLKAEIHERLGEYEEAIQAANEALEICPHLAEAHYRKVAAINMSYGPEEALAILSNRRFSFEIDQNYKFLQASLLQQVGDQARFASAIDEIIVKHPSSIHAAFFDIVRDASFHH